jgi:glycosyltransferase involved in cell wall biosynthesis
VAARLADRIVCVCPSQQRSAAALAGPARVVVVANGIDRPGPPDAAARERQRRELGVAPPHPAVGGGGRYSPQKGDVYFVGAARRVAARVPQARFVMVGAGEIQRPIARLVAASGVPERFVLAGPRDDVPDLLGALDVFVLPSLWEGLPYALLEAMAAGNAVVASAVGGVPDVIQDGTSGLLVPPGDPAALAAAMLKLLESEAQRAKMGRCAREVVATRYRIEDMLDRIAALYEGRL